MTVPVEVNKGVIIQCQDMKTTQEEEDTIIKKANVRPKKALVIADDTDIFVLLLYFCCQGDIPAATSVLMVSSHGRTVIDINASVFRNRKIIPGLLAAHGLTGCDTVAPYFGMEKSTVLKVLRLGVHTLLVIQVVLCQMSSPMQHHSFWHAVVRPNACHSLRHDKKIWTSKVS